jgi:LPXTG-motif cell wall-anchored protein
MSTGVVIGIAAAVILVGLATLLVVRRRRASA